jgi:hypothetical protein
MVKIFGLQDLKHPSCNWNEFEEKSFGALSAMASKRNDSSNFWPIEWAAKNAH